MKRVLTIGLLTCFLSSCASADLILNLTGSAGSTAVSWSATGSITTTRGIPTRSTTVGAAPSTGGALGEWSTGFDNNMGNLISGSSNDSVALNVGPDTGISYRINGIEFLTFTEIDFGASPTAGGDDVQLDFGGTVAYPELFVGDVLSWTGSGTFSLAANFDDYLVPGSYSSAIDGGSYTVNVITAVPELSSLALAMIGGAGIVATYRRRKPTSAK